MALSLVKGQKISLEKESGGRLTEVVMGLGWDAKKTGGILGLFTGGQGPSIDLDASCILFNEAGEIVDAVWFRQLQSGDGSIQHTGDNRTGAGEGDDEQIIVDLTRVPQAVKTLVFTVNSFTGQSFDKIENASCRIFEKSTGREIAKYNLTCGGSHTAMVMAKVYRHNNEWKMHAIGENASGKTFQDLLPAIKPYL